MQDSGGERGISNKKAGYEVSHNQYQAQVLIPQT